jgi:hypothetical protein
MNLKESGRHQSCHNRGTILAFLWKDLWRPRNIYGRISGVPVKIRTQNVPKKEAQSVSSTRTCSVGQHSELCAVHHRINYVHPCCKSILIEKCSKITWIQTHCMIEGNFFKEFLSITSQKCLVRKLDYFRRISESTQRNLATSFKLSVIKRSVTFRKLESFVIKLVHSWKLWIISFFPPNFSFFLKKKEKPGLKFYKYI